MSIQASQVKELREKTGCPMMDCKKALVEANGDLEAATDILRKHGHDSAAKRRDRATAEGMIAGSLDPDFKRAALVEFLCETDFVARNADFSATAQELADHLLRMDAVPDDVQALLDGPVGAKVKEVQQKLKENIRIGRTARVDAGEKERVDLYTHFNGKIGAIVCMAFSKASLGGNTAVRDLLKDLCMQTASAAPLGISREEIPAELVEKERALLAELDEVKAKPEKIRPKIIEGKLNKLFKENALLEQDFIKENKVAVKKVLKRVGSEAGGSLEIKRFARFEVGTG